MLSQDAARRARRQPMSAEDAGGTRQGERGGGAALLSQPPPPQPRADPAQVGPALRPAGARRPPPRWQRGRLCRSRVAPVLDGRRGRDPVVPCPSQGGGSRGGREERRGHRLSHAPPRGSGGPRWPLAGGGGVRPGQGREECAQR